METIEYYFMDTSSWGEGEWQHEPDKIQYQDEETGLPCIIRRSPVMGALCGYVGVFEGHPLFEKEYDDCNVDVHGGPTFSSFCSDSGNEHDICHIPAPGEPDRVWWIGFDCGHSGDCCPAMDARYTLASSIVGDFLDLPSSSRYGKYRNIEYVRNECRNLARQLKEMAR